MVNKDKADFHERERIERMLRNYMKRDLEFSSVSALLKMVFEVVNAKEIKETLR